MNVSPSVLLFDRHHHGLRSRVMNTLNTSQLRSPPSRHSCRRYRPHPYPRPAVLDEEDQPYNPCREDDFWIAMMVDQVHQNGAKRLEPEAALDDNDELGAIVNDLEVIVGILVVHAVLELLLHVNIIQTLLRLNS